jgi:beta-glucosidase
VGYEIFPRCIHDVLLYVHETYAPKAIFIAENGMATPIETPDAAGEIVDLQRAAYYVDHIAEMERARLKGVPVKGYFAWTLMDNFEWAYGYTVPFGIVQVDYATQARKIKFSGETYREIIRARR